MSNSKPLFNAFLFLILIVKLLFLFNALRSFNANRLDNKEDEEKYENEKEKYHKMFTLLMGILLIILFNPRMTEENVCVSGHTKIFLFAFGVLSIIGVAQTYMKDKNEKKYTDMEKHGKT